jgi:5-methyltetrahydrofolate--homocysteine methyltransferase
VIVNSVNLVDRAGRLDRVAPEAVHRGADVVAQTVDECGPAMTSAEKLRVATRLVEVLSQEYGLSRDAIIVDPLLFPIVSGDSSRSNTAVETLDGIRAIKAALPGVRTLLGISNLSYGAPPRDRPALNSVFLHHATQAGLDLAIASPAQVTPYAQLSEHERTLTESLIFGRPM